MQILAIDPGPTRSAWVIYTPRLPYPVTRKGIDPNDDLLVRIYDEFGPHASFAVVIEMITSYGQAVGKDVFETCLWIGRFQQAFYKTTQTLPSLMYRRDVKLHLCNSVRAKDPNVRRALIDKFGGSDEKAIGTKKLGYGPLHGVTGDMWAALAVAVTHAEMA